MSASTSRRAILASLTLVALSACAGGGATTLGYGVPGRAQVTYAYGDTTVVSVRMGGQSMELGMRGAAEYGVRFAEAPSGVRVTLSVEDLAATLSVPMAGTERIDESQVRGDLVFVLDAEGNATIERSPEVDLSASRMISGLTTAHTFFPGLPARAVVPGDRWVDTVSYQGDAEMGDVTENAIVAYTLRADTVVDGRTLAHIGLSGTTTITNTMSMGGADIRQASTIDLTGHVLWDRAAGLMTEVIRTGTGRGTVQVPGVPLPLPIELQSSQQARLRPS